ncbi:hypothetical protein NO1_1374 [Candidatus Termititenax aidoneus]|uniref:Uncharacterized protein n=1 Tax=Termititenax aidoneus TaxID=2218524 RepID=A0A388TCE2_TERA1|nr:hypothetical protein NO1_1374 [Candidatus Termititenax aidoneus]
MSDGKRDLKISPGWATLCILILCVIELAILDYVHIKEYSVFYEILNPIFSAFKRPNSKIIINIYNND